MTRTSVDRNNAKVNRNIRNSQEVGALQNDATDDSGNVVDLYMRKIYKIDLLTADEERALAQRVQKGDEAARKKMIEANLRLVPWVARGYVNRGVAYADLISEGNLGLLRAVERYDPTQGVRFATYATNWIRSFVSRSLMLVGDQHTVRIPVHVLTAFHKIRKARAELITRLEREPTHSEIAELSELSEKAVDRALRAAEASMVSIHDPISPKDENHTLASTLSDPDQTTPEDTQITHDMRSVLQRLMSSLTERQRIVIECRFGLGGRDPETLAPIAKKLGLTAERIRQLEAAAMKKIKKAADEQGLAPDMIFAR